MSSTPTNSLSVELLVFSFCLVDFEIGPPPAPVCPRIFGCTANEASTCHISNPPIPKDECYLSSSINVPPSVDTGPPPPDTQNSSPSLLSCTQARDSEGFVTVTSTRGRGTTTAAAAFLPPETVGVPQENPSNAFAALDDTSSVETPERQGNELRTIASLAATDYGSIQALLDKSFDEFFGPDSPPAPTPLRIKGLFDAGARVVDRLLSEIHEEHHRHATRTDHHLASIKDSAQFDRGALRADVTLLRQETEDALGPTICNLSGLAALAQKSEKEIHDLMASSAKNTQAIQELRQEIDGCVAVRTTVDDIKTRQLTQIRESIKRVETTSLADMATRYNTLDTKFSEGLDMVNIRVDDILRASIPPTKATTDANATPPVHNTASSPSSPPNDGATMCKPASVVPVSAPQGDGRQASGANEDMPCSNAPDLRSESRQARQSDRTNLPREHDFRDTEFSSSIRWRPHLDPRSSHHADGTFQQAEGNFDGYQGSSHTPTNPYYGSHDTRNETARSDPRRYDSQVPPSYNRRPQDVDVGYGSDDEAHLPQGGQIVSPRHWDCRQLAHSTGHSPLDAAALACREYHGYQRGYYPLTTTINKSCGYRLVWATDL